MSPEDREAIVETIKTTVNGKIDRIEKKLDEHNAKREADMVEVRKHIEETKPIIDAYKGGKTIGEIIKWVGGVAVAWLALKGFLPK